MGTGRAGEAQEQGSTFVADPQEAEPDEGPRTGIHERVIRTRRPGWRRRKPVCPTGTQTNSGTRLQQRCDARTVWKWLWLRWGTQRRT